MIVYSGSFEKGIFENTYNQDKNQPGGVILCYFLIEKRFFKRGKKNPKSLTGLLKYD